MIKGMPKVSVVDDEQYILKLIRHALPQEGFEVHVQANCAPALEQARRVKLDSISMKVMMLFLVRMQSSRQLNEKPENKKTNSRCSCENKPKTRNNRNKIQTLINTTKS